jgi:hypothetical protein
LVLQAPKNRSDSYARASGQDNKSNQAAKDDSGGDKDDQCCAEDPEPYSLEKTADLLAALKLHVDEKALETQLTYQRAVEEAINLSLLTPQPMPADLSGQQQPGAQPLNIQFPAPPALDAEAAARNAAFQRLEYIPVKMQLKPSNEIIVVSLSTIFVKRLLQC